MRVLLTTVPQPIELIGHNYDPMDLFSSRLTAGQDVFTFTHYSPPLGLYYIAQNIQSPTTVLEYPPLSKLRKELLKGYDVVGISFSNPSKNNCLLACQIIRKYSPHSKIILGGYGVQCLHQDLETDIKADGLYDVVCREEGVRFMRRFLGEPVDRPLTSILPPQELYPFGSRFTMMPIGCIIVAFGCENSCPFCQTSAYFGHKQLLMMEPKELVQQTKRYLRMYPKMKYIALFCENYLGDRSYVEKVRDYMEEDNGIGFERFSFEIMSSIKNLSAYDPEELASLGIGSAWIGVESKFTSLDKRTGKSPEKIFSALHDVGINTTGSFIIGLDEQSSKNIEQDVDYFISLKPTMTQVAALVPGPGSELWDHLKKEGRLQLRSWQEQHAYSETIDFKSFRPGEVIFWIEKTIERLYNRLGPGILRSIHVLCKGYKRLSKSKDKRLRARAEYYRKQLTESRITLGGIERYAPTHAIKKEVRELSKQVESILGALSLKERIKQTAVNMWLLRNKISGHGKPGKTPPPRFRRRYYRFH